MTRKFKIAGVLMAVVAMFALTASSASALFTSANYPATGSGTSSEDKFDAFGSTVECDDNEFHVGAIDATDIEGNHEGIDGPEETITVEPTYEDCTAFGLPATVDFTECDYEFHTPSGGPLTASLKCPEEVTGVDITIYSSSAHSSVLCHVIVYPFAVPKGGITATNSGNHVLVKGTVENITATQQRTNFLCPAGTHTNTAKYTIQAQGITIAGSNGALSVS